MRTFYAYGRAFSTCDYAFKPESGENSCKIHLETCCILALVEKATCVSSGGIATGHVRIKKIAPRTLRQQGTTFDKKWCPDPESNQRHGDFQSPALPTELSGQIMCYKCEAQGDKWWAFRDLNPGPAGYEPDALTN